MFTRVCLFHKTRTRKRNVHRDYLDYILIIYTSYYLFLEILPKRKALEDTRINIVLSSYSITKLASLKICVQSIASYSYTPKVLGDTEISFKTAEINKWSGILHCKMFALAE